MWNNFVEMLTITPISELLLIFIAKIIEVSIGTMRIILISKGYRKIGTSLAIIEIFLWVFVASSVINGISESPMKGVSYSFGFAAGVYVGSLIEQKLAFGKVMIQTITSKALSNDIASLLRASGFGVTTLQAMGKDDEKTMLMIYANRRDAGKAVHIIKSVHEAAVIVSNEISNVSGGYINPMKKLLK
ncbi:DUF5698 domain-containing protein [Acholeplasma vituli]|uniref:UPF0316 protein N7603_06275 n=1 Tax=Paracholeplasma vituli TaxID=69473 RepID=A0ABT2PWP1_9MOLU|nr:DUF5698 domain-containing protein [Paracholeplasma vituli]MCU0105260.1 DUF5698 domain-containing protein [Paracholeplasma vituli]